MKLSDIFIGRPLHWLLWLIIAGVMFWLGKGAQHVREFVPFMLQLFALVTLCVIVIVATYKPGERITREPLDEDENTAE
jgi:hypothetical protein